MNLVLADRLNKVEEYYFSKKLEQINQMRNEGIEVINLGIGSPDLMPPIEATDELEKSLKLTNVHGYSTYRSSPELRQGISEWLKKTYYIDVDPKHEILPLLGSKEGILYLSMALLNPGDGVLIPNPGYPAYSSVANLLGAKIYNYNLTEKNHWLPDIVELESLDLSRCKLMWINYPHMPTGAGGSAEAFKTLIKFCKSRNIILCNDNPYGLILNESRPVSLLEFDPSLEIACELNSFSKSFNMAGWRIGFILGSKALIDAVISVKSNVDSGIFLPIQKGAIEALKVNSSWHIKQNEIYKIRRNIIWEIFDLLDCHYDKNQVGLFVWARVPKKIIDVEFFVNDLLEKTHVFLTPGMIFGSNGKNYLRASLCSSEELLLRAKDKIKEYIA